jgi:hypothetical protein
MHPAQRVANRRQGGRLEMIGCRECLHQVNQVAQLEQMSIHVEQKVRQAGRGMARLCGARDWLDHDVLLGLPGTGGRGSLSLPLCQQSQQCHGGEAWIR